MERPQYQKLIETVAKYPLPSKYRLFSVNDAGYTKPFIKIINRETRLKQKENDVCSGVWIDIFPIDGTPQSELSCLILNKRIVFLQYLLITSASSPLNAGSLKSKIGKILLFPIARILGSARICRRIDRIAKKHPFEESKFVGNLVWNRVGLRTRQNRNLFDGYGEIEFEGHKVSVQNHWEAVLFHLYGNYRLLPPEEERKPHSVEAFILEDSDQ